ncbi:hypothetical protein EVAR_69529_1, partial [Eumeta japonica]
MSYECPDKHLEKFATPASSHASSLSTIPALRQSSS